jgi:hypothetical protein
VWLVVAPLFLPLYLLLILLLVFARKLVDLGIITDDHPLWPNKRPMVGPTCKVAMWRDAGKVAG